MCLSINITDVMDLLSSLEILWIIPIQRHDINLKNSNEIVLIMICFIARGKIILFILVDILSTANFYYSKNKSLFVILSHLQENK